MVREAALLCRGNLDVTKIAKLYAVDEAMGQLAHEREDGTAIFLRFRIRPLVGDFGVFGVRC